MVAVGLLGWTFTRTPTPPEARRLTIQQLHVAVPRKWKITRQQSARQITVTAIETNGRRHSTSKASSLSALATVQLTIQAYPGSVARLTMAERLSRIHPYRSWSTERTRQLFSRTETEIYGREPHGQILDLYGNAIRSAMDPIPDPTSLAEHPMAGTLDRYRRRSRVFVEYEIASCIVGPVLAQSQTWVAGHGRG